MQHSSAMVLSRSSGFTAAGDRPGRHHRHHRLRQAGATGRAAVRRPGSGHRNSAAFISIRVSERPLPCLRQQRPLHGGCGGAYSARGMCWAWCCSVVGRADPRRGGTSWPKPYLCLFGAAWKDVNSNAGQPPPALFFFILLAQLIADQLRQDSTTSWRRDRRRPKG